jgi:hypothetical protein
LAARNAGLAQCMWFMQMIHKRNSCKERSQRSPQPHLCQPRPLSLERHGQQCLADAGRAPPGKRSGAHPL